MKKLFLISLLVIVLVPMVNARGISREELSKKVASAIDDEKKIKRAKNEALLNAAAQDDAPAVEQYLVEGASVNANNPVDGKTILFLALENDNLALIKNLVEGKTSDGRTFPKASKCWVDKKGKTPFIYAAERGRILAAAAVIDKKCKDQPDFMGKTPLMYAAQNGHFEFVKWLRGKKVSMLPKDRHNRRASDYADLANFQEIAEYLYHYEQLERAFGTDNVLNAEPHS